MKSYRNVIIIGVVAVFLVIFVLYRTVSVDDLLVKVGYYDEKITIFNTADVHGHLIQEKNAWGQYTSEDIYGVMGFPIAKGMIKEIEKKNKNSILLDCGDMFYGTNEAKVEDGKGVVEAVNLMGYSGAALGSGDFNFGYGRLKEIASQLNYPILCSNFYEKGERVFKSYEILEVGNKKVAVFGLITKDASSSLYLQEEEGVEVKDPIEEANKVLNEIRGKADVVVLLSYLGDDHDQQLVEQVDGIDLILSSKRHNLYTKAIKVKDTYIAEAGAWLTHLGIADIYFKKDKVKKIDWCVKSTTKDSNVDKKLSEVVQRYNAIALQDVKKVVGTTKEKLDGKRINIRTGETNFGDLVADAVRNEAKADIALINSGSIRESLEEGEINLYDIEKSLPYSNSVVTINAPGEAIWKALERGFKKYPDAKNGALLQVSGIEYKVNGTKEVGHRIQEVLVNGKPIDMDKIYTVALTDYIYFGGDDYVEFENYPIIDSGDVLSTVFVNYLEKVKEIESIDTGRIEIVNKRY